MRCNAVNPKVFISHASEDKDRFVIPFYNQLRENGVDAWIDKWEIKLGDSLTQKIFDEGIGQTDAVIIILSSFSVEKPWVKEELDAALVRRILGKIRLIPLVIDDCKVPECLKHLKYLSIKNYNNYSNEFKEILTAIYEVDLKPPLGPQPSFLEERIQSPSYHSDRYQENLQEMDKIVAPLFSNIDNPFIFQKGSPGYRLSSNPTVQNYFSFWEKIKTNTHYASLQVREALRIYDLQKSDTLRDKEDEQYVEAKENLYNIIKIRYAEIMVEIDQIRK